MSNTGQGSLTFSQKNAVAGGGPPFQLNSAYNGLSVDTITGQIVLGDDLGFGGPADLVSNREIRLQGRTLQLSQLNTLGFDNWRFNIENNFMAIADTVSAQKYMLWSVDFAGNTGQFIGNARSEAGWAPPFIAIQNTDPGGLFGRIQFAGNDAMEMTDSGPANAVAIFPNTGNVAVQPSGAIDPGYKFFVRGTGGPQTRVDVAGFPLFIIDSTVSLYQLGDIGGGSNGTFLSIDDILQTISLTAVNGLRVIGDTTMIHSGTAYANGAAAAIGTLLNAPAAGNPTKWIPVDDNGTTRFIPAW